MIQTPSRRALFPRKIGDYAMPDYLRCEEDLHRFHDRDLAAMDTLELLGEEQRLPRAIGIATGRRLYVATPGSVTPTAADAWLRVRLRAVRDEASRRRSRRSA